MLNARVQFQHFEVEPTFLAVSQLDRPDWDSRNQTLYLSDLKQEEIEDMGSQDASQQNYHQSTVGIHNRYPHLGKVSYTKGQVVPQSIGLSKESTHSSRGTGASFSSASLLDRQACLPCMFNVWADALSRDL